MSRSLSLEASSSIWAQMRLVTSSFTSLPRKMMRSRSSRSKTWSSKEAPPPRIVSSSTLMYSPSRIGPPASQRFSSGHNRSAIDRIPLLPVPEGHTIHRLATRHRELFAGRRLAVGSPQGRFAAGAALVDGRTLRDTEAYGKHLFHHYDGDLSVHVHLGLYGKFGDGE